MLQQLRLKMDILRLCATQQTYARPKKLFLQISEFLRLMLQVMFRAFHFSTLNEPFCDSETHVATFPDPFCNSARHMLRLCATPVATFRDSCCDFMQPMLRLCATRFATLRDPCCDFVRLESLAGV